ncbi:MAG: DNA-binding response regulator [Cyanobacteria bacterium PR.3.49]|nr:DNA-binding response regulator [Cyanobacteria bacterium PR.3.49]
MAKLLVVEDDSNLADSVVDMLKSENHMVEFTPNGMDAANLLAVSAYDLIVLDLGLPDKDGIEVLKEYRGRGGRGKVLILTGRGKIEEKEQGLDLGADDYLTKPFHVKELAARVRALLRRPEGVVAEVLRTATFELNAKTFTFTKGGVEVPLTKREFTLLEFLMRHPNQVFSSEAIIARVWQSDSEASADTVKVYINRLRNKLGDNLDAEIKTVYGVGYKLEVAADQ